MTFTTSPEMAPEKVFEPTTRGVPDGAATRIGKLSGETLHLQIAEERSVETDKNQRREPENYLGHP